MKTIDETKRISQYLEDNSEDVRVNGGPEGAGGWCQSMILVNGEVTYKTLFLKREISTPRVVAHFEIWNERIVAIPKDVWDVIYPKVHELITRFESETNQAITVKKVHGPTQWADY